MIPVRARWFFIGWISSNVLIIIIYHLLTP
jgi:hypothetical protein